MTDQEIIARLNESIEGLLLMSESESPLTPFLWEKEQIEGGELNSETLRRRLEYPPDMKILQEDFAAFFERLTRIEEGLDPSQLHRATRYQTLQSQMSGMMTDLRVFRAGRIRIDLYIVGRTPTGAWVGVSGVLVET